MTPTPATISNTLVDRITALHDEGLWSQDHSRQLMYAAKKLRSISVAEGDMIMGMIHCMDGNVTAMRKAFKNAIAVAPTFFGARANFGAALLTNGFFSEAIDYMQQAEKIEQKSRSYRLMAIACLCLGLESKARFFHGMSDYSSVSFESFKDATPGFKSQEQEDALASVKESLSKNAEIWESLSKR